MLTALITLAAKPLRVTAAAADNISRPFSADNTMLETTTSAPRLAPNRRYKALASLWCNVQGEGRFVLRQARRTSCEPLK